MRAPTAALATVVAADAAAAALDPSWLRQGLLLDEPAHLATGALVLMNLPPRPRAWTAGFIVGSVAPDADHVPLIPQRGRIRKHSPRPPAHTLLTPLLLAAGALALRSKARQAAAGAAAGVVTHFARDVVSGRGVPLVTPLSRFELRVPWLVYGTGMAALAVRAERIRATLRPGL